MKRHAFTTLAVLFQVLPICAQPYSINWHKISGGGGSGSGGPYSLSGTIGQHDAGGPMTNSNYSVSGGFWTIFTVQNSGGPLLSIKITGPNVVMVSWPSPSTGFNLQVSTNLGAATWTTPSQTVNDDGINKSIIVTAPAGNAYYRLKNP
jgi:hypothetical protein